MALCRSPAVVVRHEQPAVPCGPRSPWRQQQAPPRRRLAPPSATAQDVGAGAGSAAAAATAAKRGVLVVARAAPCDCAGTGPGADCPPGDAPIRTLLAEGRKAYVVEPRGGAREAKGVVVFMHGFAQNPKAYYESLEALAEQGLLVVAPSPCFYLTPGDLQGAMVEHAEYFLSRIATNSVPGLPVGRAALSNVALLGHSVGGGLATHVAALAAAAGRPLKGVAVLAPQTSVEAQYSPKAALDSVWPKGPSSTQFLVQYGLADLIAPFWLPTALRSQLESRFGEPAVSSRRFLLGTHVGFQDQLFAADADVDDQVLPWLSASIFALALGLPGLPALVQLVGRAACSLTGVKLGDECAKQRQQAGNCTGKECVSQESAEESLAAYRRLLLAVAALTGGLACVTKATWDVHPDDAIRWLPLVLTVLAGFATVSGVLAIALNRFYVNPVQRPESREESVKFICKALNVNVPKSVLSVS